MIDEHEIKVTGKGVGATVGVATKRHDKFGYINSGTIVTLFDGVDNALDYVTGQMPTPKKDGESEAKGHDGGFHAFESYQETLDTFRRHPEKVINYDPTELRIKDESESGSTVEYDVTGDFIDMGRYMEGIPEVVGSMRGGNARNRRVNIITNLSTSSGINQKVIKHRGERTIRLIDALEAGGVRTMLTAIESTECNHTEVIVKRHEEPLTIADVAVVTHPEFLRRILFRVKEYSDTWSGGYGGAYLFSAALKPDVIDSPNNNELNIVLDTNITSIESVDRLFDQLERLLVWEMGKPTTEITSIKLGSTGIQFNPNGARSDEEIRREGQEVLASD